MDVSRYADLFLTESREHLSAINHSLLELERTSGSAEAVGAIFRAVHTVKGMSATMGYTAVAELSHELETLLDKVRKGERSVSGPIMDTLFAAADALEASIELSVAGRVEEIDVAAVVERVRELGNRPTAARDAVHTAEIEAAVTAPAWTAAEPAGEGMLIRVRLNEGTPLRGVRAYLIAQKAKSLGQVIAVSPPLESLQADQFGNDFAVRLVPRFGVAEIERVLGLAGDVAEIFVSGTTEAPGAAPSTAPAHRMTPAGTPQLSEIAPAEPAIKQQRSVRIDLRRLDSLMNLIGELVITRGRLTQLAATLGQPALDESVSQASRLISDLQDEIMTSRMVPVWQVFDRFPRLVRDAARQLEKRVDFSVEGKEIELDRSMLDEIGDPIVHLLRNSIDHGIETPETRTALGKSPTGRLTLSAMRDRSAVLIRVADDGRGIDRGRVLKRAQEMNLLDPSKAEIADEDLLRLISRPGFSTAEKVTDISGRGVGIDAVQNRVRALGGSVEIRSVPGQGTSVTFRLPLTLAILRALLARVGDELYAIPLTHVNETVDFRAPDLRTIKGREVLVLREEVLPLIRLRSLMRLEAANGRRQQVVILEVGDKKAGLMVDDLAGQQEVVVKQFDTVREGLPLFSGATILGDGAPALIIDVSSLL